MDALRSAAAAWTAGEGAADATPEAAAPGTQEGAGGARAPSAGRPPRPSPRREAGLSPQAAEQLREAFGKWTDATPPRRAKEGEGDKEALPEENGDAASTAPSAAEAKSEDGKKLAPVREGGKLGGPKGVAHLVVRELCDAEEVLWAPHAEHTAAVPASPLRPKTRVQSTVPTPAGLPPEGRRQWESTRDAALFRIEKLVEAACVRHAGRSATAHPDRLRAATAELRHLLRAMKHVDLERQRAMLRRAGLSNDELTNAYGNAGSVMDLAMDDAQLLLLRPYEMSPRELRRFRKTHEELKSGREAQLRGGAQPQGPVELADHFAERRADLWAEAHRLLRQLEKPEPNDASLEAKPVPPAVLLSVLGAAGGAVALRDPERRARLLEALENSGVYAAGLWRRAVDAVARSLKPRVRDLGPSMPPQGLPKNGTREYRSKVTGVAPAAVAAAR